jgi:D-alanyl-lipoteichoic acid acyltransferase DltB (MBOAT superfamily)
LGLLGLFKYFNFFVESAVTALSSIGIKADPITLRLILPVGISFYTFQTLSYTIDIYRRDLSPTRSLLDYSAFVSFFPQLVAGPIERASRLLPQFSTPRVFNPALARDGLRQMLWGAVKKVAIADNLALVVNEVYGNSGEVSGVVLLYATVCFAFQIYCDFSGYSDIAIGCARLFGIRLSRNFAYPYFSQNMAEVWRRWHISLSTWFRDYVYIPLGGSRGSRLLMAKNVMVTFAVSGLWHGASWNFVIWGAINGLAILPTALRGKRGLKVSDVPGGESLVPSFSVALRILLTFGVMCLAWVFFRAETLAQSVQILNGIWVGVWNLDAWHGIFAAPSLLKSGALVSGLVCVEWIKRAEPHPLVFEKLPRWQRWMVYTVLLFGALTVSPGANTPFIYFQF